MLNVNLLGGASFSIEGVLVKSDLGPAGRLLAYYLFEFFGRVHRRERLADLFWGDTDPDKARSALNTAVWRIRKILDLAAKGAACQLITSGSDVILEQSPSIQVDTHQLQEAYKLVPKHPNGGALTARDEQEISAAVDRYGGPFLEAYDNEWVLLERERLHCLFVRSTFELMRTAAMRRQYERALDYGRRILAMDAWRESTQRDVILLLVMNGQRAEAIRTYQRLKDLLRTELNIDPVPETKRLYNDIVSGEIFSRIHEYAQAQFGIQKV
jgi:DNA-binding SARP family transcriptional activator